MKQHWFKSRAVTVVLALLAIVSSSGCEHYYVSFNLDDEQFKPKGTSIAVISGTKEPQNVALAQMVGDSLRKKSRYHVASASQISGAIAPYPQTIKGPYKSAYFSLDVDWDMTDKQKIASIQRTLGVDYLYVIWAPIQVSTNGSEVRSMPAIAQLFEKPNSQEVAKTDLGFAVGDEGGAYLKEGVDALAQELAEQTKMAVGAKKNSSHDH